MADQVFEIEAVKRRALDALAGASGALTTMQVAGRLGLPFWSVDAALEDAFRCREAVFTAGEGWRLAAPVAVPLAGDARPAVPVQGCFGLTVFGKGVDHG